MKLRGFVVVLASCAEACGEIASETPTRQAEGGADVARGDASTESGSTGTRGDASVPDGSNGLDASEAGAGMPPSCAGGGAGRTNCGANEESCCTSVEVEGGTYFRTYTHSGSVPGGEADLASVSSFRLDKYLVTVGRFREFVNAVRPTDAGPNGYVPPAESGKHSHLNGGLGLANSATPGTYELGWVASDDDNIAPTDGHLTTGVDCDASYATWTSVASRQENLPMNCVNWYEAYAFCIWDGGFLPSEAEWEYAAAGGGGANGQREYPWGSTAPGTANLYAIYDCDYGPGGGAEDASGAPPGSRDGSCTGVANIAPVGAARKGAGRWGELDLAGEISEWNLDWYASYAECVDCANLTTPSPPMGLPARVFRGGDFGSDLGNTTGLHPWYRSAGTPTIRADVVGLRCARSPL